MALDHYVPRVYLRHFCSDEQDQFIYAFSKNNLNPFRPNIKKICSINNGNTNIYTEDYRAIEKFLKEIEPKYDSTINKLSSNKIDTECIHVISGLVAYIRSCSPASQRIRSEHLKCIVEEETRRLSNQGVLPEPPPELGFGSLSEMLTNNQLQVEIDKKYPQAIGINLIQETTRTFETSQWEVLLNEHKENNFFTSDYPTAIERNYKTKHFNILIALSPSLALRIHPVRPYEKDPTLSKFRYRIKKPSFDQVISINKTIVQCAENIIFYKYDYKWIPNFIKKYAAFRIEESIDRIPNDTGAFILCSDKVVKVKQ